MNIITIKGRLTGNPELKTSSTGKSVVAVNVAVDYGFGENKKTDFFTVVAWEKLAEFIAKYFSKGQEIIVVGEMHSRKYKAKDGTERTAWEIVARTAEFCGAKANGGSATPEERKTAPQTAETPPKFKRQSANIDELPEVEEFLPLDDGDLPF